MELTRRRFLQWCALIAGCCINAGWSGCGGGSDIGDQPSSAEGSAQPPARPDRFLLRNELDTVPDPEVAVGTSTLLLSMGHITDTHITLDGFSVTGNPSLEAVLDSIGGSIGFGGLDRPEPQERYDVDVLQAVLKTLNAVTPPLDLIVHTGDAVDAGTPEELNAFLSEFNRSDIPWFQTVGNHDRLALGNIRAQTAETFSDLDFLDLDEFIQPHFFRAHKPTLTTFGSLAMGFDFGPGFTGDPSSAKGYFAFNPVPPVRDASRRLLQPGIRLYVLDTTNPDGGADGSLDEDQTSWLSLDLDMHKDSLCLIASHHQVNDIEDRRDDLVGILFDHPQVILVLSGHEHLHRIRPFSVSGSPERGFWQIQTSSLIDFPQEARILEIHNNGDGTGTIRTFVFQQNADGQLGENARASLESAQTENFDGSGTDRDRNVDLLFQFPRMT